MSYDIIGDVHGHADQLEGLLRQLGYRQRGDAYPIVAELEPFSLAIS
jgi:hypothetical protein